MKTQETPATLAEVAAQLNLSIVSSAPQAGVDPAESKDSKAWPHIAYTVSLHRNGKEIWSGPYKLGIGHVKAPKPVIPPTPPETSAKEAAKLASIQGVEPKLEDVVHSLVSDGSPFFYTQDFEEWASEY